MGLLDFAGGTVVHINAGVAALVAALVMGRRKGFPGTAMPPHNLTMTVAGAAMLWVGWFGFNAGSALAANGNAGMAMLVTHIGAASGAMAWMFMEWTRHGKPSVLGIVTGMVAGLGTITPASGYVGPMGALIIGLTAGVVCYFATAFIKRVLHVDDTLDVFRFGVAGSSAPHGRRLCPCSAGGAGGRHDDRPPGRRAVRWCAATFTCAPAPPDILKLLDATVGLRVTSDLETEGSTPCCTMRPVTASSVRLFFFLISLRREKQSFPANESRPQIRKLLFRCVLSHFAYRVSAVFLKIQIDRFVGAVAVGLLPLCLQPPSLAGSLSSSFTGLKPVPCGAVGRAV
jgi:hypothetical protein